MEVSGQLHTPATEPLVLTGQEAGWYPELIWTQWQREKIPTPARKSNLVIQLLYLHENFKS